MKISKSNRDLSLSPENYWAFSDLLKELLSNDSTFKAEYLLREFESKLLDERVAESPEIRRKRAIEKWLDCEVRNCDTSQRLYLSGPEDVLFIKDCLPVSADDVLTTARRFILETLGDEVPWEELSGSFSGGASTSIKRGVGNIATKYQEGTDVTESAIKHFIRLSENAVWPASDFNVVAGNVMFTVPKSTTIDRCACKEPEFNMYVQKAIGDAIRVRLKRVGINLNDQSVNQRLARQGSIDGSLATIDLSSASDSVTRQLVLMLLPEAWFYVMDDVRSPITVIDGNEHVNTMFSSMGNAFTFELESLIFWALCRACAYHSGIRGRISVYGDDIIIPSGMYEAVAETLNHCGFLLNAKKSFATGPFRESCGAHWFNGQDVTPFYVKDVPVDVSDWCLLLNKLRRWCHLAAGICDPDYFGVWELFAGLVPKPLWGTWDLASRSALSAPGRRPLARVVRKHVRHKQAEEKLSAGAYIHWLDTSEHRTEQALGYPVLDALETSRFESDGHLVMRRHRDSLAFGRLAFPQEV